MLIDKKDKNSAVCYFEAIFKMSLGQNISNLSCKFQIHKLINVVNFI